MKAQCRHSMAQQMQTALSEEMNERVHLDFIQKIIRITQEQLWSLNRGVGHYFVCFRLFCLPSNASPERQCFPTVPMPYLPVQDEGSLQRPRCTCWGHWTVPQKANSYNPDILSIAIASALDGLCPSLIIQQQLLSQGKRGHPNPSYLSLPTTDNPLQQLKEMPSRVASPFTPSVGIPFQLP